MKISSAIFLSVLLLTSPGWSHAQSGATFGTPDCGEWTKLQRAADRAWLLGYLSGLNMVWSGMREPKDPLNALQTAHQAFVWMDTYCKANPLSKVSTGGTDLFFELIDIAERKR